MKICTSLRMAARYHWCLASLLVLGAVADALTTRGAGVLWYDKPAATWVEALPVGNGSLGGMIFGDPAREHIQFNEGTLWTGDESKMGAYQPFGEVFIELPGIAATDYRRQLSLEDAIHRVTFTAGGVKFQREVFSSFPDQVLVIRLTADQPGALSGTLRLRDMHPGHIVADGHRLTMTGTLDNGLDYEAQACVLAEAGTAHAETGGIQIAKADRVTILLVAGTSFCNDPAKHWREPLPHEKLVTRLATAAGKTYEQLRAAHVADYQQLFNRVHLNLGPAKDDRATDERLAAYQKDAGDPALDALFFQYGRYLLIGSSRPGGLPANLQGIWNTNLQPAWYCGYTTDINVEMNYWLAEPTALSECAEPLFAWIKNLAAIQKKSADPKLKCPRGWIAYSTNNPYGGNTGWAIHRPGSAWLTQHLWTHYQYGGDLDFLKTVAYPALKDVVEYWEDYLVARPDGKLITPAGWSPEHGPVGKNGNVTIHEGDRSPQPGASYDQEIVWDLLTNYIEAAEALGVDADYRAKVVALRDRLLVPKIGKWGQLQEWMEDVDDPKDHHRHTSHLFAVHPGRQISPLTTPELAQAATVSLNARGDGGTGWSKAWKINFWARLGAGNHAHTLLQHLLTPVGNHAKGQGGGVYANLFDAHPPFQIDGNFGATSGMTEMLLQSHIRQHNQYVIDLLPALPDAWPTGNVTGLRARGGLAVDIAWQDGKLTTAHLVALQDNTWQVRYGSTRRDVKLAQGQEYRWEDGK